MLKMKAAPKLITAMLLVAGCTDGAPKNLTKLQYSDKEKPVFYSSGVRGNLTPETSSLDCLKKVLLDNNKSGISIAIGDIRDYTGKRSDTEGFMITQGGAMMAYSALGRLQPAVVPRERFDTRIADAELKYMSERQLGDGTQHTVDDPKTGKSTEVPWKPYFGGTVQQSDYYIVGGITELNYNIQSGGAQVEVNQIGPRRRTYTANVAVDLRIVGTQSLTVYRAISLQKQVTGYEVGAGIFRFFGSNLFDINIGKKSQEPIQMAVRMAIQAGIVDLVSSVTKTDAKACRSHGNVSFSTKAE